MRSKIEVYNFIPVRNLQEYPTWIRFTVSQIQTGKNCPQNKEEILVFLNVFSRAGVFSWSLNQGWH